MPEIVKVLVVEDEPLVRFDLSDFLADAGYSVLEASDADQAVQTLQSAEDIHVIVTDVDMPGSMDGLALARAVAEQWPHIRIVVVSGHRRPVAVEVPSGAIFVPKPYGQDEICGCIAALLK